LKVLRVLWTATEVPLAPKELFIQWYNEYRPHSWLGGATPHEMYFQIARARDGPRLETRANWPLDEEIMLRDPKGAAVELVVTPLEGRPHLPLVELKAA
jgi:hypothetical protein